MTNVFTNRFLTGTIQREAPLVSFAYNHTESGNLEKWVSLSMPAGSGEKYMSQEPKTIHPVFAMNLPEGRLRESIARMFTKPLTEVDDFLLLQITGRSQIGRLRFAEKVEDLDTVPELPLDGLLKSDDDDQSLFNEMLNRYAAYSGVAGVQPKVLARDNGSLEQMSPPKNTSSRLSVSGTTHIVKFFDSEEYPALATNEFLCLSAAKAARLNIPNFFISDNSQCLVVERFDIDDSKKSYMGFEDCCSLAGLQPNGKYQGSYEHVAKTLARNISPGHLRDDMPEFFRSLVLSTILRNGDAHRKNFGLIYNDERSIRLSPAFDIVTTTPYIPKDSFALMLAGSKRWPNAKKLAEFGVNYCQFLTPKEAEHAIRDVCDAVAQTRPLVKEYLRNAPNETAANLLKTMLAAWETGLKETATRNGISI